MKLTDIILETTKHEKVLQKAKLIFKAIGKGTVKIKPNSASVITIHYEIKGYNKDNVGFKDMVINRNGEIKHTPKIIADDLNYWFAEDEFGIAAQYYNMEKRKHQYQTPFRKQIMNELIKKFKMFGVVLEEIPMVKYTGPSTQDW